MSTVKPERDSIGDRMKRYENVTRYELVPRMPSIVRIDGRAFHTWTRGLDRPFDASLRANMLLAACALAKEMQGFKVGYHQSDEVSFLMTDYDDLNTEPWFGRNIQKIASVSASVFTMEFARLWIKSPKTAVFDARVFSIPEPDAANYFLWRARDWSRNSLAMYCDEFFSHKQLNGKNSSERHDLLHGIGKNWTTGVPIEFRNGTFFWFDADGVCQAHPMPTYDSVSGVVDPHLPGMAKRVETYPDCPVCQIAKLPAAKEADRG